MKKYIIPVLLFFVLLAVGSVMALVIVLGREDSQSEDTEETQTTGNPSELNDNSNSPIEQPIEETRIKKSTGLKYNSNDEEYTLLLDFLVDPDYDLQYNEYEVKNEVVISFDSGELVANIEHMAIPRQFSDLVTLKNEITGDTFYRVVDNEDNIVYISDLMDISECKKLNETIEDPCGYSRYKGILITCSSNNAIPKCDKVMKTLVVENGPQLDAIEE